MAASDPPADREPDVVVIGHQWWWEARYPSGAVTANEIHIPTGKALLVRVESADVIHDFWVPAARAEDRRDPRPPDVHLDRRRTRRATYLGRVRGVLRAQHAWMRILVVAQTAGGLRRVGASTSASPRSRPTERRGGARARQPSARRPASTATPSAAPRRPRARVAPTSRTSPSARRSAPACSHNDPPEPRALAPGSAGGQAGQPHARPQPHRRRRSATSSPTSRRSDERRRRSPLEHAPSRTTPRTRRARRVRVGRDGRPQAHRHPLPGHGALLLRRRRHRGAPHAPPARAPEQHARVGPTRSTSSSRCTARR